MFFKKKRKFRNLTLEEIKGKARVLFIDDEDRKDIIEYLSKSGWLCRQLHEKNFDTLDQIDIIDSHIICVDINGVGENLGKNNGLDIVVSIKNKTPSKKVIIYSSQSTQNIFHEAIDLADKKILKSAGDYEVFKNTIEDLAKIIFSWDEMIKYSYEKIRPYWSNDLSIDQYKKIIEKNSFKKDLSPEQLTTILNVTLDVANIVYQGVQLFL